eukprot:gene6711-3381_t
MLEHLMMHVLLSLLVCMPMLRILLTCDSTKDVDASPLLVTFGALNDERAPGAITHDVRAPGAINDEHAPGDITDERAPGTITDEHATMPLVISLISVPLVPSLMRVPPVPLVLSLMMSVPLPRFAIVVFILQRNAQCIGHKINGFDWPKVSESPGMT